MELASMLAAEPFSDRAETVSPVIGAFLRTYNDGLDDERRQDLYPIAALVVGTAASRGVEQERAARCLRFARSMGAKPPGGRAAMGMATPEAAGSCGALAALRSGPSPEAHAATLAFVRELAELADADRWWRRRRLPWPDPARAFEAALADFGPSETTTGRAATAPRPTGRTRAGPRSASPAGR
jgi:hypothetical protein